MTAATIRRISPKTLAVRACIPLTPIVLLSPGVSLRGWRRLCSHDIGLDSIDGMKLFGILLVFGSLAWAMCFCAALAVMAQSMAAPGFRSVAPLGLIPIAVGLFSFFFLAWKIDFEAAENAAFQRVIANGRPLITALTQYKNDHGTYPYTLETLVPDYLSGLPHTGVFGQAEFRYNFPMRRYGNEDAFELYVRFGIEDNLFYVSDPVLRETISDRSPVFLPQTDDWFFEDI